MTLLLSLSFRGFKKTFKLPKNMNLTKFKGDFGEL